MMKLGIMQSWSARWKNKLGNAIGKKEAAVLKSIQQNDPVNTLVAQMRDIDFHEQNSTTWRPMGLQMKACQFVHVDPPWEVFNSKAEDCSYNGRFCV